MPDATLVPAGSSPALPTAPVATAPVAGWSPVAPSAPANAAGHRCHTAQLTASLGARTVLSFGQVVVPLRYTNTSARACLLHGVPGLDLHGPADPNGPVYSLRRMDKGGSFTLAPGASASARVVVLTYTGDGSLGSEGSLRWTPTQLVTIPPGETTALTVGWPAGLTVLRQDEATRPGSWVESFTSTS
jgi:Protein of unknown function (DUF4232)